MFGVQLTHVEGAIEDDMVIVQMGEVAVCFLLFFFFCFVLFFFFF